jgi:hypothetical protein
VIERGAGFHPQKPDTERMGSISVGDGCNVRRQYY